MITFTARWIPEEDDIDICDICGRTDTHTHNKEESDNA